MNLKEKIMNPIKAYKKMKELRDYEIYKHRQIKKLKLIEQEKDMIGKYCAFGKDLKCFTDCAHFSPASVTEDEDNFIYYKSAKCKLWRIK